MRPGNDSHTAPAGERSECKVLRGGLRPDREASFRTKQSYPHGRDGFGLSPSQ